MPQSSFGIIQHAILILEKVKGQMNGSAAHDSFTTVDSVIFSLRFQFLLILDADYKLNKLLPVRKEVLIHKNATHSVAHSEIAPICIDAIGLQI